MRQILLRILIAALFAGAAIASWGEAARLEATADVWQHLVVLENDVAAPPSPSRWAQWLPAAWREEAAAGARQKATGDYWLRRYETLARAQTGNPDPLIMHTAASAAYRLARQGGEVGQAAAQKLDPVIEAYGEVLKADPTHPDAAWNYEFVSRTRDVIARARLAGRNRSAPDAPGMLPPPAGRTVHGLPGAPPPDVKTDEFDTIAPLDYGDREAQPEATPGSAIKRKG